MAAGAGSVNGRNVTNEAADISVSKKENESNHFRINQIAVTALTGLFLSGIAASEGVASHPFYVSPILAGMGLLYAALMATSGSYTFFSQNLSTLFVGSAGKEAVGKILQSKTFYQLYSRFGLENSIKLFGLEAIQDKFHEEVSEPKTTLAHLIVRYDTKDQQELLGKGVMKKELFDLIARLKKEGAKHGQDYFISLKDSSERHAAYAFYNSRPRHFREVLRLNELFRVEKAKLGFGVAPTDRDSYVWEKSDMNKPTSEGEEITSTDWKRFAYLAGAVSTGLAVTAAVALATFDIVPTKAMIVAVPLLALSRGFTYLRSRAFVNASGADKKATFDKHTFIWLSNIYGVQQLLDAGFTVDELKQKLKKQVLHPGSTPWDLIWLKDFATLKDKGIITEEHFKALQQVQEDSKKIKESVTVPSYARLTVWEICAQAADGIKRAEELDRGYAQNKVRFLQSSVE